MNGKYYVIKNTNIFCKYICEYKNGIMTTMGLQPREELEDVLDNFIPLNISYDSTAGLELPVDWESFLWYDDYSKKQHIKEIDFNQCKENMELSWEDNLPIYIMEDGTRSETVTLAMADIGGHNEE